MLLVRHVRSLMPMVGDDVLDPRPLPASSNAMMSFSSISLPAVSLGIPISASNLNRLCVILGSWQGEGVTRQHLVATKNAPLLSDLRDCSEAHIRRQGSVQRIFQNYQLLA